MVWFWLEYGVVQRSGNGRTSSHPKVDVIAKLGAWEGRDRSGVSNIEVT